VGAGPRRGPAILAYRPGAQQPASAAILTSKEQTRGREITAEADPANVTATLKDGILSFTLPKAAPAKKIRIEPKAA